MNYTSRNWIFLGISVAATVVIISVLTAVIGGKPAGTMILGSTASPVYPFTLQNIMILLFFIGLGQLWVRWLCSYEENVFLKKSGFLPEDGDTVLADNSILDTIRTNAANAAVRGEAFLPDLINVCIIQFFKTRSVNDTLGVLNSTLDLNIHRLELRYSMIRYIAWAIPTFGFIGTVVGLADGIGRLDISKFMGAQIDKALQFKLLTADLAFAFNTTIVALCLAVILVFLLHVVQRGEEEALNKAGKYVLTNLINRLSLK